MEIYIEDSTPLIQLMCRSSQWDGLTESKINDWLANFKDTEGKYFALRILRNCIYYSENDIVALLKYGLFDKIYGRNIAKQIIRKKEIETYPSIISSRIAQKRDKTLFIPLLDKNKPHESGLQVVRYLVQSIGINEKQSRFHWDIKYEDLDDYELIVIIDDCIGSGHQLVKFWNLREFISLKRIAISKKIKFYYLALVGYEKGIEHIKTNTDDLEIIVCDILTEKHRVFSDESVGFFWTDKDELTKAKMYFSTLERNHGVSMYGYNNLDFAVIIHRNIPDWTLPVFWENAMDWNILLPRKDSNIKS